MTPKLFLRLFTSTVFLFLFLFLVPPSVNAANEFNGIVTLEGGLSRLVAPNVTVECTSNCSNLNWVGDHFDARFNNTGNVSIRVSNYPSSFTGCRYEVLDRGSDLTNPGDDTMLTSGNGCNASFNAQQTNSWRYGVTFILIQAEPPPSGSCWKSLGRINGLGCGTTHTFSSVNATAFRFNVLSGGGPDCAVSYGLPSSGHPACQVGGGTDGVSFNTNSGKVYADPVNVCPLVCGEWRETASFPVQSINQLTARVGCNDSERMDIELWYCEGVVETPVPTPTLPPPPDCRSGLNCCKCISEGGVCLELSDFCADGFVAQCAQTSDPDQCNENTGCTCVPGGMGGGQCGGVNQACCPQGDDCLGNNLYCDGGVCRTAFYQVIPGRLYCHENGSVTRLAKDRNGNPRPIYTAIGCVPIHDKNEFTSFMFTWAIGIAGGFSFLLLLYGGFLVMTSQGDPHRLSQGKVIIGAAISGLFLLIFSATLLRIIGVNILNLPEF